MADSYTRKILPTTDSPNTTALVPIHLTKAAGKAMTLPIPFKGKLVHAEIQTLVAIANASLVVTVTNGNTTTLGTLTAAVTSSDVGDTADIAFDSSAVDNDLIIDNEDLTLTMAGASAGEVMCYFIFEPSVNQDVIV